MKFEIGLFVDVQSPCSLQSEDRDAAQSKQKQRVQEDEEAAEIEAQLARLKAE